MIDFFYTEKNQDSVIHMTLSRIRAVQEQWIIGRLSPKSISQSDFDKDYKTFVEQEVADIAEWLETRKNVSSKDAMTTMYQAFLRMGTAWQEIARKQIEEEFRKRELEEILNALDFAKDFL